MGRAPETLIEAIRYFSDPDVCLDFMVNLRWPDGIKCPTCGSPNVRFISTRRIFQCGTKEKHPRKQFSVKVGTIFEDSPIGLDKWFAAIWLIANAKNGISSLELSRAIGLTQKSAWFVLHRIRLAMQTGTFEKLSGEVEADETFIGGKARNMHPGKRPVKGTGPIGKAVVMGLLERHGHAVVGVVPNNRKGTVQAKVRNTVAGGSTVYTDALSSYQGLESDYAHHVIDHAEKYVDGLIHTNGLENFWSLLKRSLNGTYVSVEPYHLFRYLDEQSFRFNNREDTDQLRFARVAASTIGRRVMYKHLTGND
jgi:transposase-like protein